MIRQAFDMVGWFGYVLVFSAAACLSVPVCWWIERRVERLDREAWDATFGKKR